MILLHQINSLNIEDVFSLIQEQTDIFSTIKNIMAILHYTAHICLNFQCMDSIVSQKYKNCGIAEIKH